MKHTLAPFVVALDLFPAPAHCACASGFGRAEDMWMPADELRGNQPNRLFEVATSVFLERQRQENALEQEIADLVEQLRVVADECGVGDLVCLLDGMRDDRASGLLAVPRALEAKALGQLLELDDRVRERHGTDYVEVFVDVVDAQGSGDGV